MKHTGSRFLDCKISYNGSKCMIILWNIMLNVVNVLKEELIETAHLAF